MEFLFQFMIIMLVWLSDPLTAAPSLTKPGCSDRCGNISIPYPFGIGSGCYYNEWYAIACNNMSSNLSTIIPVSRAYLIAVNLEVLNVVLENQTVTINSPMVTSCGISVFAGMADSLWMMNLTNSPFLLSKEDNKFIVMGCGNAVLSGWKAEQVVAGCTSICTWSQDTKGCYGINCCQTTIPYYLDTFNANVTGLESSSSTGGPRGCSSAFLVDRNWFPNSFTDPYLADEISSFPVVLLWTITVLQDFAENPHHVSRELELGNGSYMLTHSFACGHYEDGNPYLNGCQVVEACASCSGFCYTKSKGDFYCEGSQIIPDHTALKFILGASIGIGTLLVAASAFWLYRVVQERNSKKRTESFFKRNGGLLLQRQMSANSGAIKKTGLFGGKELEMATDHFNENRILGRGGQGTVYKGMLTDGRIVAVKKSKLVDESQLEHFINEVVILSQINHRNVVKLLGCCLETEVPMLVYEFVANGTLFQYIHDKSNEFPTSLNMRLKIAAEVAGALAYLHSATSVPIYHRDIKTTNILLDEKFRAKISDFGTSRSIAVDQTHLTTTVKGTFGYLDPEYFQSSQFTEKSDVYSFGVVLVELLTGQKPIFRTETGEPIGLVAHFILSMEGPNLLEIIDDQLVEERNHEQLTRVANLAKRCLKSNGKMRPIMKEVASELEAIRLNKMPSTKYLEGDLTTIEVDYDISSSFEVSPLLSSSF